MQAKINIGFDQLVENINQLSNKEKRKLISLLDKEKFKKADTDLTEFLLSGPTFGKDQLKEIEETRNRINQWRAE